MKYLDAFRDRELAESLAVKLRLTSKKLPRPITLMEVCGTHTMAIYRHGLKSAYVPDNVRLVSGPGCPVCVTPMGYVDAAISLSHRNDIVIVTFGDMARVPGSNSTLARERAKGADIRIVYSPIDAVAMAEKEHGREFVFLGVGFETTAPTVAVAILTAERDGVKNFSALTAHKVMPEPMDALTEGELKIDGYICPAHVSAIIGEEGYRPLVAKRKIPCVITGFEPLDILQGVTMLCKQIVDGRAEVENQYRRVVRPEGNRKAQETLNTVFVKSSARWRGLGDIPDSGLSIAPAYSRYDAAIKFSITFPDVKENKACLCGEILRGLKEPADCRIFGNACTPETPIGACMVSSEGTCSAAYKYGHQTV